MEDLTPKGSRSYERFELNFCVYIRFLPYCDRYFDKYFKNKTKIRKIKKYGKEVWVLF